jgi:hypothetical protein
LECSPSGSPRCEPSLVPGSSGCRAFVTFAAGWLVQVICMFTSRPNLALALVHSSTVSSDVEPPAPVGGFAISPLAGRERAVIL